MSEIESSRSRIAPHRAIIISPVGAARQLTHAKDVTYCRSSLHFSARTGDLRVPENQFVRGCFRDRENEDASRAINPPTLYLLFALLLFPCFLSCWWFLPSSFPFCVVFFFPTLVCSCVCSWPPGVSVRQCHRGVSHATGRECHHRSHFSQFSNGNDVQRSRPLQVYLSIRVNDYLWIAF